MSNADTPAPSTCYEFWLMDASNRMVGHDRLADKVILEDFAPYQRPGLSIHADAPFPLEEGNTSSKAVFHKHISLPFPLPDMEALPTGEGLIALRQIKNQPEEQPSWMSSPQKGRDILFHANSLTERELFLPLCQSALAGLSYLHDQSLTQLHDMTGQPLGPAYLLKERPYCLILGNTPISLPGSLDELKRIAGFLPGEEHIITLKEDNISPQSQSFLIRRLG